MKRFCILVAMGAVLVNAPKALADSLSFESDSSGIIITGTLTGNLSSPGVFDITSGDATVSDSNWAGADGTYALVPDSPPATPTNSTVPVDWFIYDNLLTAGAPSGDVLDNDGLYFYDSALGLGLNIYGNGSGQPYSFEIADSGGYRDGSNDAQFSLTPEPDSLVMVSTGVFFVANALFLRRRRFSVRRSD